MTFFYRITFISLLLLLCATAHASDSITMRGTSIAMPVTIDRIHAGRVFYTDRAGRSQQMLLEEVSQVSFADLAALDQAHAALRDDEYRTAIQHLHHAFIASEHDMQRLWIRAMLCQTHDILGHYVQASGHFAAIMLLDNHASWQRLAPTGQPNEPSFAAAEEAMTLLRAAQRVTDNRQLSNVLNELVQKIEPIHRRLAASYTGPRIEPGTTISGIAISDIEQMEIDQIDNQANDSLDDEQTTPSRSVSVEPASESAPSSTSPAAIDRLLDQQQWREALELCQRAAEQPGRRDQAELLYQYGRALLGSEQPADASVMFMRCAILHRGSPFASRSLIETAVIYRDYFQQPSTARRLLDRASHEESAHGREEIVSRIEAVKQTLP